MIVKSVQEMKGAIFTSLRDREIVTIFPTEIARRYWINRFVMEEREGVVRLDSTLAWDAFKGKFLPKQSEIPANNLIRELFVLQFLRDEAACRPLKWFWYRDYPEERENLASAIRLLISSLKELENVENLPGDYRHDAELIKGHYTQFLQERGLYDPLFLAPSLENFSETQQRYRLFFPEVCRGWCEFSQMENFPPFLETVTVEEGERPSLELFSNELMEVREKLNTIKNLVEEGIDYSEIVISAGDLERVKPYLEHEATLRGIPLTVVKGDSPLHYGPGKFFSRLANLYTSNFSPKAMRSLLLEQQIGWKEYSRHTALLEKGIEYNVTRGAIPDSSDEWIWKLGAAKENELLEWYKTLKRGVIALMRASNMGSLFRALFALQDFLLLPEGFAPQGEINHNVYLFIIDLFTAVGESLKLCQMGEVENLFQFLLKYVGKQNYIENRPIVGVAVYDYKVAVGIAPPYHFLIGCDQRATEIRGLPLPLLHESYMEIDDEESESDIFLNHYHYSGERVVFSSSKLLFGGESTLVPIWFTGRVTDASYKPSKDLLVREERSWAGSKEIVFTPYQHQKRWLERASKSAFTLPIYDLAIKRGFFPLWERAVGKEGLLHLSATQIDTYNDCPFKWLSNYLFKIRKGNYDTLSIDHLRVGQLLHSIIATFFTKIETFDYSKSDTYIELIEEIALKEFEEYRKMPYSSPDTTLLYLKRRHSDELKVFIEKEGKDFDLYSSYGLELTLEEVNRKEGYHLLGRIDRVATKDGLVAVIDYKKGVAPTKGKNTEIVSSFQLPVYAKLIESQGELEEVDRAAFYSFSNGRYSFYWKEKDRECRDDLVAILDQKIHAMIQDLKVGAIGATPSQEACSLCDYRQVCRRRFALP